MGWAASQQTLGQARKSSEQGDDCLVAGSSLPSLLCLWSWSSVLTTFQDAPANVSIWQRQKNVLCWSLQTMPNSELLLIPVNGRIVVNNLMVIKNTEKAKQESTENSWTKHRAALTLWDVTWRLQRPPKRKFDFKVNMKNQLHGETQMPLLSISNRIELGMEHRVWSPVFHLGQSEQSTELYW